MDSNTMEKVLCSGHSTPCILKTGTNRTGPMYKKSFYMCSKVSSPCDFVEKSNVMPMKCPIHSEVVSIRLWDSKKPNMITYFCGKREQKYCGRFLNAVGKENVEPMPTKELKSELKETKPYSAPPLKETNYTSDKEAGGCSESEDVSEVVDISDDEGEGPCSLSEKSTSNSMTVSSTASPPCQERSQCSSTDDMSLNVSQRNGFVDLTDSEESVIEQTEPDSSVSSNLPNNSQNEFVDLTDSEESVIEQTEPDSSVSSNLPNNSQNGFVDLTDSEESAIEQTEPDSSVSSNLPNNSQNVSLSSPEGVQAQSVAVGNCTSIQSLSAVQSVASPLCQNDSLSLNVDEKNETSPKNVPSYADSEDSAIEETDGSFISSSPPGSTQIVSPSSANDDQPVVLDKTTSDQGASSALDSEEKLFKVGYQRKKVMRQYYEIEHMIQTQSAHLPDGGAELRAQRKLVEKRLRELSVSAPKVLDQEETARLISQRNITAQSKMLTAGAVERLHSSLENCPTKNTLADDPEGLTVTLMTHQKRGLAWMVWRETQTPAAGILADDMGLGKTLSMLSLVVKQRRTSEETRKWTREPAAKSGLLKTPATLVVCPASLLMQWEAEAKSKFHRGEISVLVYHGSNRTTYPSDLTRYDLVVTTYNIVGTEEASCESDEPTSDVPKRKRKTGSHTTLFQLHWQRVILDEAHNIKNPKTAMSVGCCKLYADNRWAVTGTPIQNSLKDFYSLIKFIHLAPFDDFHVWKDTVERKGMLGMQRLNTMVSSLVLRRTKEELSGGILKLTKKIETRHTIKLRPEEMIVYKYLYSEARKVMVSLLQDQGEHVNVDQTSQPQKQDEPDLPDHVAPIIRRLMRGASSTTGKGTCVLWMLLRLRQTCCHLKLLINNLDLSGSEDTRMDDVDLDLRMGALSLDDMGESSAVDIREIPEEFKVDQRSTKVAEVISEIRRITQIQENPPQKCVVVSQWTQMLDIVSHHLDVVGISYTRIDGSVAPTKRLDRVHQLNSPRRNPSVMLLALQAGGVGLNLVGANHLFLLDMHWNPALEQQAADRCHRVGQTRDVYIHKFVCEGTVEERILSLQEKKLQLASNVLAGASEKNRSNKLTLNDLKDLFELNN